MRVRLMCPESHSTYKQEKHNPHRRSVIRKRGIVRGTSTYPQRRESQERNYEDEATCEAQRNTESKEQCHWSLLGGNTRFGDAQRRQLCGAAAATLPSKCNC